MTSCFPFSVFDGRISSDTDPDSSNEINEDFVLIN